jgi:hypothetical protein
MTAKNRIETTAAENGWTVFERNYVGSVVEYRRGRRYVRVYFKATESVQAASYDNRFIAGTGKADRVIAQLEKPKGARRS